MREVAPVCNREGAGPGVGSAMGCSFDFMGFRL